MEEKLNQSDLSAMLAKQCGLSANKAETFTRTFFEAIIEGLENDGYVKINGLGTFEIVDVDNRSIVNVNTDKKIDIKGERKISFIPSEALKEKVNAPFAMFEPVEIDDEYVDEEDGVSENVLDISTDDDSLADASASSEIVATETTSTDASASGEIVATATAIADVSASSEILATETASTDVTASSEILATATASTDASASGEILATATASTDASASSEILATETTSTDVTLPTNTKKNYYLYIVCSLLFVIAVIATHYFIVDNNINSDLSKTETKIGVVENATVVLLDTVTKVDSININIEEKEEAVPFILVNELSQTKLSAISTKDTLHYKIAGNMAVHKVGLDETLVKISLKYYNDKRLWQYIVKHNDLRDFNKLEIGMEIHIPLLVPRK